MTRFNPIEKWTPTYPEYTCNSLKEWPNASLLMLIIFIPFRSIYTNKGVWRLLSPSVHISSVLLPMCEAEGLPVLICGTGPNSQCTINLRWLKLWKIYRDKKVQCNCKSGMQLHLTKVNWLISQLCFDLTWEHLTIWVNFWTISIFNFLNSMLLSLVKSSNKEGKPRDNKSKCSTFKLCSVD